MRNTKQILKAKINRSPHSWVGKSEIKANPYANQQNFNTETTVGNRNGLQTIGEKKTHNLA